MPRWHHDMGGVPGAGPIDRTEHQLSDWEILAEVINEALTAKGIRRTAEMRRAIEDMDGKLYRSLSYYERWAVSIETIRQRRRS